MIPETPKREVNEAETRAILERWSKLKAGDVVPLLGVTCKIVNVNGGKRRLTLTPPPEVPMPHGETDPIFAARQPTKKPAKRPQ